MADFDVDLLVLGGGAAGLTASGVAANLGAKTMMVERDRLGGDCTWTGCVPSKTLLHAAALRAEAEAFRAFAGPDAPPVPAADFAGIMAHVRRVREEVYHDADRPEIFEGFGVEVVRGDARLVDAHTAVIELADGPGGEAGGTRRVTFRLAVLCTGSRPAVPPVPGLADVPHLTNHGLFEIAEQPAHLVVLGAGPIGCEMAQAFRRLGSDVTVVDRAAGVLGRDDADHAAVVQAALAREGVRFVFNATVERADRAGDGVRLTLGSGEAVEGSHLLVAVGRQPNVDGLGLDAAGVVYTPRGIQVDKTGRTSQRHIFAAGDCTGEFALTHMSEHTAKQAVTTALLKIPAAIDREGLTWTTFTSPEIAQLGPTEAELKNAGARFVTYRFPYTKVDRAITEGRTEGHIKVLASPVTGKILGASAVGERAGEIVAMYAIARKAGGSVKSVSDTIIAYPTYALAARRAADQFYVQKQFPLAIDALKRVFGYRGDTPPPPDPDRVV